MGTGFLVLNDDGYIQVDDTYRNLALVAQGSDATDTNFSSASFTTVVVSGLENPVFAITHTGSNGVTVTSSTSTGSGTNKQFSWVVYGAGAAPVSFDYFVFDSPPVLSGDGSGIIVRDSSSNVTFDSRYKYLRIVNFSFMNNSFTPIAGRRYATIFSGGVIKRLVTGGTGQTQIQTTTGYFTTGERTIDVYTGPFPSTPIAYSYETITIDVTDY